MSTAAKYLSIFRANLRLNISSAMEYRFSFWSQVLFMILNNSFMLFFWWVFFDNFQLVRGWGFNDILLLYALSAGSFSIACIFAGNSILLGDIITKGELDFYLLLPLDPLFNALTSRIQVSAVGDLAFALALAPIALGLNPASLFFFLLLLLSGGMVLTAFFTFIGSLTFFWGHNRGFANLAHNAIITFATYPEPIFTGGVRLILYTLIPAAFVAHVPLGLLQQFTWDQALLLLAATLILTLLARWIFARGVKKYESGNLMVTRL